MTILEQLTPAQRAEFERLQRQVRRDSYADDRRLNTAPDPWRTRRQLRAHARRVRMIGADQ